MLGFSIYNPDKVRITEFSRLELQCVANVYYLISSLREVLMILVWISQLDIAMITVLVKESMSILTIHWLLADKVFVEHGGDDDAQHLLNIL